MERLGCSRGTGTKAESGCNSVLCTRNMDNITGKLRDVSKVALLSGGPGRRAMAQVMCQMFVVSKQGKIPPLQQEKK